MKKLVLFIFLLPACAEYSDCYQNFFEDITDFEINPDMATGSGIKVDSGGFDVDLFALDARIGMMEWCITGVMANNPEPDPKWQCLYRNFTGMRRLKRSCLIIKIVPPVYSKCSKWQFIGVPAPNELCRAKGINPTPECPCMWRTAVQDDNVVITPPALYLWEIGRIMTSCNNIWESPFAPCLGF
jgi:hypothetical protein